MKLYKEFVILGGALVGSILLGCWLLSGSSDQSPTVDMVTPVPLETKHTERTVGETNEIHSERNLQGQETDGGE